MGSREIFAIGEGRVTAKKCVPKAATPRTLISGHSNSCLDGYKVTRRRPQVNCGTMCEYPQDHWRHKADDAHQRPLSLRFEYKPYWPDLQRELGVNNTGAAIILDICATPDWVSYSRTARHYEKRAARYNNALYTWRRVVGQVDHLDAFGALVEHDRRLPGQRGWQSAIKATPELRSICSGIVGGAPLTLAKPVEVIVLKNADGELKDYRDSRETCRMRRHVEHWNEAIMGANLDPSIAAPLARIFNGNWARGGRFYALGASWQNIKREARKQVTIAGEPVAELDYACIHPAILYAQTGAAMPADCYDIDGWPRELVKTAVNILLNARSEQGALTAIAQHRNIDALDEPGTQTAYRTAARLIADIKRVHRPIAHAFHSDAGARLQIIDAKLVERVSTIMLRQGVLVLPVHDSFLVALSKADQLEEAMLQAAYEAGFAALRVSAK